MLTPQATADGSFTFFSETFQEAFHSASGAQQEAEQKFVQACQLPALAQQRDSITLLDVCYGLGYNTAAALTAIWSVNPQCHIHLVALEQDSEVPRQALQYHLLQAWPQSIVQALTPLVETGRYQAPTLTAQVLWGDARQTLRPLAPLAADAIFLDPFSPPKCPQLWTVEFIQLLAQHLGPTGVLATYSCAASVRTALRLAGLCFGPTPQVGRRSPGTLAQWTDQGLRPLSPAEREHLQTRAAIPYRDPSLRDDASTIHQHRRQEQSRSDLEPTSRWKKRWLTFNLG
ncbi:MnmC family methyltransferase [Synechocystis sp. LKSZ1]|uniref:tRNA (5-methylaminomethyl-2-thiouridine)(34)-methyltransferase MnmD n=1 Tax=Synechocystis sp. LKSZ1 TaxID=3144951 RepID=UPI00336BD35F